MSTSLPMSAVRNLIDPDAGYRDSYISMLREHQAAGRFQDNRHIDNDVNRLAADFPKFVESLRALADPEKVRAGRVPEFHYWLVEGDEVIARSTFRIALTEEPSMRDLGHIGMDTRPSRERQGIGKQIIGMTLDRAREAGLPKALLTCDSWNVASQKIIVRFGGVLERAVPIPGRNYQRLRYWITL